MRRLGFALVVTLALATAASAIPVTPWQIGVNKNQEVTSGSNAAVAVTIAGVTGANVYLYGFAVRCSAGSANVVITDGGTQKWSSDAAFVGTTTKTVSWPVAFSTAAAGNAMVITLGACGVSNTGVLSVQADQY